MSEKLSDWFDPSVKPTINGWYERKYDIKDIQNMFDWWDGKQFLLGTGDGETRAPAKQKLRWRGLAEKPEA